jgi:hypothetical protein
MKSSFNLRVGFVPIVELSLKRAAICGNWMWSTDKLTAESKGASY